MGRFARGTLSFFSSYLLVCILLGFLFILTLLGTLEQVDNGLFEVQKKYFNSYFLVHDAGPVGIPLPGANLVLMLLSVNIVLGGLVRIRKRWATAGVMVIHVGIVVMMAAALVKLHWSDEGYLQLYPGERSDEYVSYHLWEVAIFRANETDEVTEFLIPEEHFSDLQGGATRTFKSDRLPFELTLSNFTKNCRPLPKGPMWDTPHPVIAGYALRDLPLEKESEFNIAGLYVKASGSGGPEGAGLLWGAERYPWIYEDAGGERWAVTLRHKRYPMPYTIAMDKFTHELHPRTGIPKSFKSDVTKLEEGESPRSVLIQMNEPLRAGGLILFQARYGPPNAGPDDPKYSHFAVVRNPSDHWPTISWFIIAFGLLYTFLWKLVVYIIRQSKSRVGTTLRTEAPGASGSNAA